MIDFELLRTEVAGHPYPLLFATVSGALDLPPRYGMSTECC